MREASPPRFSGHRDATECGGDTDRTAAMAEGCAPGPGRRQEGARRPRAARGGVPARQPRPVPRGPTGVRAQVAREGVPPAAGVVAEVALEGLLPRVQLDVPQQVALLREGGPALAALEGPLACGETEAGQGGGAGGGDTLPAAAAGLTGLGLSH